MEEDYETVMDKNNAGKWLFQIPINMSAVVHPLCLDFKGDFRPDGTIKAHLTFNMCFRLFHSHIIKSREVHFSQESHITMPQWYPRL